MPRESLILGAGNRETTGPVPLAVSSTQADTSRTDSLETPHKHSRVHKRPQYSFRRGLAAFFHETVEYEVGKRAAAKRHRKRAMSERRKRREDGQPHQGDGQDNSNSDVPSQLETEAPENTADRHTSGTITAGRHPGGAATPNNAHRTIPPAAPQTVNQPLPRPANSPASSVSTSLVTSDSDTTSQDSNLTPVQEPPRNRLLERFRRKDNEPTPQRGLPRIQTRSPGAE